MSILDQLPSIRPLEVKPSNIDSDRPFVIISSRDVTREEIELLESFGRCLVWDSSFVNIPLKEHRFSYCILDIRNKIHRNLLMKENLSQYHTVGLINWWESLDDWHEDSGVENTVRALPPRSAFKQDFDRMLLTRKISKPSCAKSGLRMIAKFFGGWPRDDE